MRNFSILLCGAAVCLTACGGGGEMGSRMADEARQRAETAAANVVANDSVGIMQLQDCILQAKAEQSEYLLLGDTAAADTFDVAFRQYVERHNPRLASEMFNAATARKR